MKPHRPAEKPRGSSQPPVRKDNTRGQGRGSAKREKNSPQSDQPILSALDLGTNNCRLLIARPYGNSFRVVDAFSRIVRLGEGLAGSGKLSADAIDRTVEALKICARKMRDRGVTHMRNVATQACRQASNCDEFVARVRRETGIELDIITPAEEARLAVMGCQALLDRGSRRAIVFDIGGGSTELIWTTIMPKGQPKILGWMSMPLGVVNMSEIFMKGQDVTPESYRAMVDAVRERLIPFDKRYNLSFAIKKGGVQMIGTSGTITTLTSVHLDLPRYDRSQVDGAWVATPALLELCRRLAGQDYETRAANKCVGTDRAELIVAGCAILDGILSLWPVPRIRVADRGIREGMLIELMHAAQADMHMGTHAARKAFGAPDRELQNV